jgi:SH3-like domain-containing protein
MPFHQSIRVFLWAALACTLFAGGCAHNTGTASPFFTSTSTVTAYRLNVRAEPSTKARIIEVIARGDAVEVLDRQYGWIKVRTPNNHIGWAYGAYLSGFDIPKPEKDTPESEEARPEGTDEENMGQGRPLVL